MYFVNDEHKRNFESLLLKYGKMGENMQYKPTIYAAALPEVYKCFDDIANINVSNAPLLELMEYNEIEEVFEPSAAGLTGSTRRIVEFGMSCYNGYPIGIDEILGSVVSDEHFQVLIQMMKIRAKK